MQRVLVLGTSGSGKSTLAQKLAERTGLPYVATDPLYWGPDWRQEPAALVQQRMVEIVAAPAWVLDGNFDDLRPLVWGRADTILWLDYPLRVVLPRLLLRNFGWALTRRSIWSGNTMTFARAWSGVRHCLRSHGKKRHHYPAYLSEFPHADVLRFRYPKETEGWLVKSGFAREGNRRSEERTEP